MTGVSSQAGPVRVVLTVAIGLACTTLPLFLTGALSTRLSADIGISTTGLGLAVAAFFLGGGLASIPGGRMADRLGSSVALRIGFLIATLCSLTIGGLVANGWQLILTLFLGGFAVALVDTSGARALAAAVRLTRQGLAFGVKEASIPVASLLAGVTLPILGQQIGWRPAFVGAAVLAAIAGLSVPPRLDAPRRAPGTISAAVGTLTPAVALDTNTRDGPQLADPSDLAEGSVRLAPLVALAVAAGLGGGVAASVATFLVRSSESAGLTASAAGLLLAVASAASIVSRLGSGLLADRLVGGELRLVAGLLVTGTLGVVGLAIGWMPLLIPAAVLALGGGWGWTGLMFLAAVRIDPRRPARAAGIVLVGLALGGTLGPISIGSVADRLGFSSAWTLGAIAMAIAGVVTLFAERSR